MMCNTETSKAVPPATSSAPAPIATREGSRNGTANLDAECVTACRILRPGGSHAPPSIPATTYRSTLASPRRTRATGVRRPLVPPKLRRSALALADQSYISPSTIGQTRFGLKRSRLASDGLLITFQRLHDRVMRPGGDDPS